MSFEPCGETRVLLREAAVGGTAAGGGVRRSGLNAVDGEARAQPP
jgi:hypothetical protein